MSRVRIPSPAPSLPCPVRTPGTNSDRNAYRRLEVAMVGFLLWVILFILCWPLALIALFLYPIVWLLLLPFRLVGIAVGGVLELVWALITLPARVIRRVA